MSSKIQALLLDMDGVLWRDTEPIGDLPATLKRAEGMGFQLAFVSNNATRTDQQNVEKFKRFGVEIRAEQIFTSAKATALFLRRRYPDGGTVYAIGEEGLHAALEAEGFQHGEEDARAVVVGLDRQISYEKLTRATLLLRSGLELIGTNPDVTLPSPEGLAPGAGSLLAALKASSDVEATIIGKPKSTLLEIALESLGIEPQQALMVGDRVETDIAAGQAAGCQTALVLSGATDEETGRTWQPQPDYVEHDLESLLGKL